MKWIVYLALEVCLWPALAQPPVPRPAVDFQMLSPSGKVVKLSDYRGKVVVVQFLYTTCTHCQATARTLNSLEQELGPRGLQVLGIAFNPDVQQQPGTITDFIKSNNVAFPVGAASRDTVLGYLGISVMERFAVPQIVIIDRRGSIRAQSKFMGSPELQDVSSLRPLLDGLLQEHQVVKRRRPTSPVTSLKPSPARNG
jgi:peroxiredoxin